MTDSVRTFFKVLSRDCKSRSGLHNVFNVVCIHQRLILSIQNVIVDVIYSSKCISCHVFQVHRRPPWPRECISRIVTSCSTIHLLFWMWRCSSTPHIASIDSLHKMVWHETSTSVFNKGHSRNFPITGTLFYFENNNTRIIEQRIPIILHETKIELQSQFTNQTCFLPNGLPYLHENGSS